VRNPDRCSAAQSKIELFGSIAALGHIDAPARYCWHGPTPRTEDSALTSNFWLGLVAVPLIKPLFQSREGLSDAIDRLCFAGTVGCSNQAEAQVLAHRQARDDAPVLRHVAEPAVKADMRSFAENLLAAEHDAAGALGDQPKPQIP
jgi:hypothetical protein